MTEIFISYRRDDSRSATGRLAERLQMHFGAHRVFRDQDSIAGGADFVQAIRRAIAAAGVALVVIGPRWLGAGGRRRLDDPADMVRIEIEAALEAGVALVPVLVEGAAMPAAADLPPSLQALARCQAVELSDSRWGFDADRLVRLLQSRFAIAAETVADGGRPGAGRWLHAAARIAIDLPDLMARPRRLIVRRQAGSVFDLATAIATLLLCVVAGNVLLASALGRPAASLLVEGILFGLLVVALLSAPLALAWRLVGRRIEYRQVVAIFAYVWGGAWLWFCCGALLLVVGVQLADPAAVERATSLLRRGAGAQNVIAALENAVRGPAAAWLVVATVVWAAALVWIVVAWGAFRAALVASRAASAGATAIWLGLLAIVAAAARWASGV